MRNLNSILFSYPISVQWVASIDLSPNETADANILVTKLDSWTDQEAEVNAKVEETLAGEKVDAILCVAGGWAGGSAKAKSKTLFPKFVFRNFEFFYLCICI